MSKHTPKPWHILRHKNHKGIIICFKDYSMKGPGHPKVDRAICLMSEHADKSTQEVEADANLIAAAPEMLEFIKEVSCPKQLSEDQLRLARLESWAAKLISKAEGKDNEKTKD